MPITVIEFEPIIDGSHPDPLSTSFLKRSTLQLFELAYYKKPSMDLFLEELASVLQDYHLQEAGPKGTKLEQLARWLLACPLKCLELVNQRQTSMQTPDTLPCPERLLNSMLDSSSNNDTNTHGAPHNTTPSKPESLDDTAAIATPFVDLSPTPMPTPNPAETVTHQDGSRTTPSFKIVVTRSARSNNDNTCSTRSDGHNPTPTMGDEISHESADDSTGQQEATSAPSADTLTCPVLVTPPDATTRNTTPTPPSSALDDQISNNPQPTPAVVAAPHAPTPDNYIDDYSGDEEDEDYDEWEDGGDDYGDNFCSSDDDDDSTNSDLRRRAESCMDYARSIELCMKLSQAERLYRRGVALFSDLYGPQHAKTVTASAALGRCLLKQPKHADEGEQVLLQAIKMMTRRIGVSDPITIQARTDFAGVLVDAGRTHAAEQMQRQALELCERQCGSHPCYVMMQTLQQLAHVLVAHDTPEKMLEAENLLRRVLEMHEELHGLGDERTIKAAHKLAICLAQQHKWAAAETVFRRVVNAKQDLDETLRFAALHNTAQCLLQQYKHKQAEEIWRDMLVKDLADNSKRKTAVTMTHLSLCLIEQGKSLAEARSVAYMALSLESELGEGEKPVTQELLAAAVDKRGKFNKRRSNGCFKVPLRLREMMLFCTGNMYISLKRHPSTGHIPELGERGKDATKPSSKSTNGLKVEGKDDDEDNVEPCRCPLHGVILEAGYEYNGAQCFSDADHLALRLPPTAVAAVVCMEHGKTLHEQGKLKEAAVMYTRVLAIQKSMLGATHVETGRAYVHLAGVERELEECAEAKESLETALAIFTSHQGLKHLETLEVLTQLASLNMEIGEFDCAEKLFVKVISCYENVVGRPNPKQAHPYGCLASISMARGNDKEAEQLARKAMAVMGNNASKSCNVAMIYNTLGVSLMSQNRMGEAEPFLRKALGILDEEKKPDKHDLLCTLKTLSVVLIKLNKHAEAEPVCRRLFALIDRVDGNQHAIVNALNYLVCTLVVQGKLAEAEPLCRQALSMCTKEFGANHTVTKRTKEQLTMVREGQREMEKEMEALLESVTWAEPQAAAAKCKAGGSHQAGELGMYRDLDQDLARFLGSGQNQVRPATSMMMAYKNRTRAAQQKTCGDDAPPLPPPTLRGAAALPPCPSDRQQALSASFNTWFNSHQPLSEDVEQGGSKGKETAKKPAPGKTNKQGASVPVTPCQMQGNGKAGNQGKAASGSQKGSVADASAGARCSKAKGSALAKQVKSSNKHLDKELCSGTGGGGHGSTDGGNGCDEPRSCVQPSLAKQLHALIKTAKNTPASTPTPTPASKHGKNTPNPASTSQDTTHTLGADACHDQGNDQGVMCGPLTHEAVMLKEFGHYLAFFRQRGFAADLECCAQSFAPGGGGVVHSAEALVRCGAEGCAGHRGELFLEAPDSVTCRLQALACLMDKARADGLSLCQAHGCIRW